MIGSLVFIFITPRAFHALLPSTYSWTPSHNTEKALHCVKYDVQWKNVSLTSSRNSQGTRTIHSFIHPLNQGRILCAAFFQFVIQNFKNKIYRIIILPVFCMGVKLGRWHWERNAGWGCFRIGCWGEYLGLGVEETTQWGVYDLYSSPSIVQVIKLRRIRWAEHVVHMGERRVVYRV